MADEKAFTVYVIDDDQDDRELFCEIISGNYPSIKCITSADGSDALTRLTELQNDQPDLIFLDMSMPKMNGEQFMNSVKTHSILIDIPIVICSTSKVLLDTWLANEVEVDSFVKPSSYAGLKNAITEKIDKYYTSRGFYGNQLN